MISVVIPVFNEQENVVPLYYSIEEVMQDLGEEFEVIFIDDGSNDNTLTNLKSLFNNGIERNSLRIIEFENNFGQTPALMAGFTAARGELICTMDGDLQNDPNDIPKMLEALTEDVDVVCGWRKNRQDNLLKKVPSKINNLLNRQLNKVHIHDSGCTLRIYRREAVQKLQLYAEGHRYIPAILAHHGFRLGEVETNHRPRIKGETKYGAKRLFRGFVDLITLHRLNRWSKKPSHLFSLWTMVFQAASLISFIWLLLERFAFYHFWSFYNQPIKIITNPLLLITIVQRENK
jgi:glycosyltransferase involved in cell wall biosynthesis